MVISNERASKDSVNNEVCAICGDDNASPHYGVAACFGCKGFFRRSIKAGQKYICRLDSQCVIDKDKRSDCRFCRLERCLKMGMSAAALRPDRDSTGKQYRLRRSLREVTKVKKPTVKKSSANEMRVVNKNRFAQKTLLMQLMNLENSINLGAVRKSDSNENASDQHQVLNKLTLDEVLENYNLFNSERTEMRYDAVQTASLVDITSSVRRSIIAAVDWINGIGEHFGIKSVEDKLALIKNCYVPLTLFSLAARTSQSTTNPDAICLPFGCCIKRNASNNIFLEKVVSRTLDDLIRTLNKLNLEEREIVALKAIIALNPDATGLLPTTGPVVSAMRDRVLLALFQNISDQFLSKGAVSRFGSILLLLSPIATISSLIAENAIIIQHFLGSAVDPLLLEILLYHQNENCAAHEIQQLCLTKRRLVDKECQTDCPYDADVECNGSTSSWPLQWNSSEAYECCSAFSPEFPPLYSPSLNEATRLFTEREDDQENTLLYSNYYQQLPILDNIDLILAIH